MKGRRDRHRHTKSAPPGQTATVRSHPHSTHCVSPSTHCVPPSTHCVPPSTNCVPHSTQCVPHSNRACIYCAAQAPTGAPRDRAQPRSNIQPPHLSARAVQWLQGVDGEVGGRRPHAPQRLILGADAAVETQQPEPGGDAPTAALLDGRDGGSGGGHGGGCRGAGLLPRARLVGPHGLGGTGRAVGLQLLRRSTAEPQVERR